MKAITLEKNGTPAVLTIQEIAEPQTTAGGASWAPVTDLLLSSRYK